jgi:hypothetical protein
VNGDGDLELLLSAYNQHLYAFDKNGYLVDDVRLAGQLIGSPLPLYDEQVKRTDAIVASWNLLAFRLKPGAPISPYGAPDLLDRCRCGSARPARESQIQPDRCCASICSAEMI